MRLRLRYFSGKVINETKSMAANNLFFVCLLQLMLARWFSLCILFFLAFFLISRVTIHTYTYRALFALSIFSWTRRTSFLPFYTAYCGFGWFLLAVLKLMWQKCSIVLLLRTPFSLAHLVFHRRRFVRFSPVFSFHFFYLLFYISYN